MRIRVIRVEGLAYSIASSCAAMNSSYLAARCIYPQVTAIVVDQGRRAVAVSLRADASALVPSVRGGIVVRAKGRRRCD